MFHNTDLLLVICFFLTVGCQTDKVFPPENMSLTWINDFNPHLSWSPPRQHSMRGCYYTVKCETKEDNFTTSSIKATKWTKRVVMYGGFLQLSVTTTCNHTNSEPVVRIVTHPDLVKENWNCDLYFPKLAHCYWEPVTDASNIDFYYSLVLEHLQCNDIGPSSIQECPSYKYIKEGQSCDLEASYCHKIYISFRQKRNNTVFWNTFEKLLLKNVKLPRLNWTVHITENKFKITWSQPDIGFVKDWKYTINYTECKETKIQQVVGLSHQLDRVSHCPYRMSIKAKDEGSETEWSEEKQFAADSNPNMLVYATFIIPSMFAGLAVLTFVCCARNKKSIFPKVPQPRDLLSDISDNKNKSALCNLYIPAKQEENCNFILVIDPQVNQPDSCNLQPLSETIQGSQIIR